ncbi:hypothetical protein ES703_60923 [subsurface metagenome]
MVFTTTEVNTLTSETTHLYFKPTVNNLFGKSHHGYLHEVRNSSYTIDDASVSFMFTDFEGYEAVSTRIYSDYFPNELSEIYNIDNNLITAINDFDDGDPANDIIAQVPSMEDLLTLTHPTDGVPAIFEQKTTFENGEFTQENILIGTLNFLWTISLIKVVGNAFREYTTR